MHFRMPIPEDCSKFTPFKLEHFNLGIVVVVHWDLRRRCSYVESSDVVKNAVQPDHSNYQVIRFDSTCFCIWLWHCSAIAHAKTPWYYSQIVCWCALTVIFVQADRCLKTR